MIGHVTVVVRYVIRARFDMLVTICWWSYQIWSEEVTVVFL